VTLVSRRCQRDKLFLIILIASLLLCFLPVVPCAKFTDSVKLDKHWVLILKSFPQEQIIASLPLYVSDHEVKIASTLAGRRTTFGTKDADYEYVAGNPVYYNPEYAALFSK